MESFKGCPDNKAPKVELMDCPKMVTNERITTGTACSYKASGAINIPTDTKNTAPNKSFTGFTKCSICSACVVSAMMEPIMKAPSAGEKPTLAAKLTIVKHSANEMMSNISSVSKCLVFLSTVGMIKIPPKNQITRKNTSFNTDIK